jgi:NitT/TauT family transport system ATP-binding protein
MTRVLVRDVWKEYGPQIVLERINLDIVDGAFVSLVGPSGCGKSTFLRILLGQEQATRGTILIDDQPLRREPGPDRGVVFQRYSVFPHLSVVRNVLLAFEFAASPVTARLWGPARREALEKSEVLLARVGLSQHRDKYPGQLSGGMQQRLAIAQALAREPRILLLDEPFGALDPGTRVEMHELVSEQWRERGMTIVMVTHDLREAFKLGTRVIAFDRPRTDPQAPERFGATITYDLPMDSPLMRRSPRYQPAPLADLRAIQTTPGLMEEPHVH